MRCMQFFFISVPLLAALLVLFVVEIKAMINYIRNERDEWLKFVFYTGKGYLRYEYRVPLVKKEGDRTRFKLVKGQAREMRGGTEKESRLMPQDIIKKLGSARTYLKDHRNAIEDIRKYLNRKNIKVELKIKLKQGTGDAAQTGMICGLLWIAAGIFAAHVSRHLRLSENRTSIIPSYNKRIFEVDASCIFHVRLVHIIVVLKKIYYMKYLIKIKSKNR